MTERFSHQFPFGAALHGDEALFRIWAPSFKTLSLELNGKRMPMLPEGNDWFVRTCPAKAGDKYSYVSPDGMTFPDPASRGQAGDVHDASLVIDPCSYEWQHPEWKGRPWHETVIYELHPGVFGGFDGIREQLPRLKALGVTAIELMPVSEFPGAHNWGYDGVMPYAPDASYGTADQFKAMIDAAHGMGLMVFLDVVYNHFGPDGAYIHAFAETFFRDDIQTPWGAAIDFRRTAVRQYFEQNALYWLNEYRLDGLRFDAVQAYRDAQFLDGLAKAIHAGIAHDRRIHLVIEHDANKARHLRVGRGEPGFDAQWTDDFHHAMHVLLTGELEGYYEDYTNPIDKLARCLAEGFAYQGETSKHSGERRGESSRYLPTTAFVMFLQNHDQIGNRALGERLTELSDPDALRAAMALLLLSPFIPLLFMGEEVLSRTPFLFFTDHNEELAEQVRAGRREEFKHFPAFQDPARRELIPDPNALSTFERSKPDFSGDDGFVRTLLALRAKRIVPGIPGARTAGVDVLTREALVAHWRLGTGERLGIAINFGKTNVSMPTAIGELVYESLDNTWSEAKAGSLHCHASVAWIEAAR